MFYLAGCQVAFVHKPKASCYYKSPSLNMFYILMSIVPYTVQDVL